jgi:histidine ammonia-lyase
VAVSISTRADITVDAFERVAWRGQPVAIAAEALERVEAARAGFLRLLERPGVVVYGVTSGYGDRAGIEVPPAERPRESKAAGLRGATFGDPLPERVTRGIVLARLTNLVGGHAAVTAGLVTAVAALLDGAPLPPVPLRGNGGSGEILALGHLFGPLMESFDLGEKEGLALINGSPCAAALAADAVLAGRRRLRLAYDVLALSVEAYRSPLDAYDSALIELWGDTHETRALEELRERLDPDAPRRSHQGPVAFRILPRVLGEAERALALAEDAAAVSLRSVTDNPVYVLPTDDHPDGRVLSTGGYHNAAAPAALHRLALNWADLAQVVERHVERHAYVSDDRTDAGELVRLLLMLAVGYAEDARTAAQPVVLPRGGPGQNDVVSPAFLAWERERAAGVALEAALAALAAAASFRVDATALTGQLERLAEETSAVREALAEKKPFGETLGRLAERFRAATAGEE